jgi:hypothetical protein
MPINISMMRGGGLLTEHVSAGFHGNAMKTRGEARFKAKGDGVYYRKSCRILFSFYSIGIST